MIPLQPRSHVGAVDRLVRLQRLTAELASAIDAQRIAEVVVDHILHAVGALTAGIWLVEGDVLRRVRTHGFSDEQTAYADRVPLTDIAPIGDSVLRGALVMLRDREDYAARYPQSGVRTRSLGGATGAIVCVPLVSGETRVGALTYVFDGPRTFDADEQTYFELLAAHVVEALERARLFGAERAARARVELLYELVAAAARAETLDAIFEPALDAVCRALAVDRASILLYDDGGVMRFRAWRGLSDAYRAAVDGHSPWTPDTPDPQPVLVGDAEKDPSMAAYAPIFDKEQIRALAFFPLVYASGAERRLIGKFMIYCREPRIFTEDDVRLASTIATQLAQAIARRAAEDETRRARAAAEHASLARAEMMAVVAHDLRNPLGVAQLKAKTMMARLAPDASNEALRSGLDTIIRSTQRMQRLIADLLDAASIEAGGVAVERSPHVLADVVNEVVEFLRALAEERRLRMTVHVDPPDLRVPCDRARVQQVLSNVVGNAIKYTPPEGDIRVAARMADGLVHVSVEDSGPGIAEEQRERVFERYVHGANRGSVGLGLFIARGLIVAHGGRIWIERAASGGARVCFTLPGA